MRLSVSVGDVLGQPADVLIATANPWLNLSGGVNGALLQAIGEEIQTELHQTLAAKSLAAVPVTSVIRSNPYHLPFEHILHAVAIDPFYDSSIEIVRVTIANVLLIAAELGARTVAMPTLATGYGPLSIADFGEALCQAVQGVQATQEMGDFEVTVVVRTEDNAETLRDILAHCRTDADE